MLQPSLPSSIPGSPKDGHGPSIHDLDSHLANVSITSPNEDSNPWTDAAKSTNAEENTRPEHTQEIPDLPSLAGKSSPESALPEPDKEESGAVVSSEVLNEFDPLVDAKEKEALAAWKTSEGHPMRLRADTGTKTPSMPAPVPVPVPVAAPSRRDSLPRTPVRSSSPSPSTSSPSAVLSSFASSLAKTFTLPRPRPRSMEESHASVLSPNSIQSFVIQQGRSSLSNNDKAGRSTEIDNYIEQEGISHTAKEQTNDSKASDDPLPFDFQNFLDQMKSRSAEPVAKYLRSFLSNFAKRSFPVNDQVKLINDFLNFISVRMRECDVWRTAIDSEFDNAMEGMEKLVMNRLYDFTFTPQLAESDPPRPITTDDLERDRILGQRIALFGWVEERHLDVPDSPDARGFLMFAQQELLKINHYKAPRDKLICILNCCKVVFGLLRHLHREENADSFVPILIYAVLKANPPHMISNIEYIQRFRSPKKLQGEAGYYLSSLMGAVQFIETLDHSGLSNITADEFERNVEEAIHNLPPSPSPEATPSSSLPPSTPLLLTTPNRQRFSSSTTQAFETSTPISPHAGEESAQPLHLSLGNIGANSLADDTRRFLQRTGDTLSKPLNALGRILGEALDGLDGPGPPGAIHGRQGSVMSTYPSSPIAPYEVSREQNQGSNVRTLQTPAPATSIGSDNRRTPPPIQTPYKPRVRHYASLSTPSTPASGRSTPEGTPSRSNLPLNSHPAFPSLSSIPSHLVPGVFRNTDSDPGISRTATPALDIPGMQAEIDRAHERAANAAMGTLTQIFPNVDSEVIDWVLEAEGGDLGRSIEKLLEVTGGT